MFFSTALIELMIEQLIALTTYATNLLKTYKQPKAVLITELIARTSLSGRVRSVMMDNSDNGTPFTSYSTIFQYKR